MFVKQINLLWRHVTGFLLQTLKGNLQNTAIYLDDDLLVRVQCRMGVTRRDFWRDKIFSLAGFVATLDRVHPFFIVHTAANDSYLISSHRINPQ
jgi:hypothetical protein